MGMGGAGGCTTVRRYGLAIDTSLYVSVGCSPSPSFSAPFGGGASGATCYSNGN